MGKEDTSDERRNIAEDLEGLLGADIDAEEEQAIYDAIEIISPEYAEGMRQFEQEVVDEFKAELEKEEQE